MPTKEIQELYNEIKETKSSSPSYARYVTAMNSLNEEMTGLMNFLLTHNRNDDAIRATTDKNFLEELLSQFRNGTLTPEKP